MKTANDIQWARDLVVFYDPNAEHDDDRCLFRWLSLIRQLHSIYTPGGHSMSACSSYLRCLWIQ